MNRKARAARISVLSNSVLIVIKCVAGVLSGSVSIVSEAIHSGMDLLAALIAFFSVRVSDNPPDNKHQYGHGKFENISGVIEALLIFVASGWIIYEAIMRLFHRTAIHSIDIGIAVMAISSVVNILVSRMLYRVARETNSVALEADALHLKADVYTSAGVAVGLLIIRLSGLAVIDSIVAIAVAIFILREAFLLLLKAVQPLIDVGLSAAEMGELEGIIANYKLTYHKLRTRRSGSHVFIDMHLLFPGGISIGDAHDTTDILKSDIRKAFSGADVTIHMEPE
ncbi:MAG: cation diffusion facilitator family transporter [Spirochaetota bacterium]